MSNKIPKKIPSSPAFLSVFIVLAALSAGVAADTPPVNINRQGLAVRGYDVVAYFTEGKPVAGRPEFETRWQGATWRFASARHREMFLREADKYAPQFGGYCAYAVSRNYTADADPAAWTIVDSRLYLNYSRRVQALWAEDTQRNIARGRTNWPGVLQK